MNNTQGKIWGKTSSLFNKNNVEIHRIETQKGGFCSKHKHNHKFNLFYVESGSIKVTVWKNDYDLIDETLLINNESTIVAPGEYHNFECLEDSIVYEIYWTQLDEKDIIRENVGGKI
jgi:quercetin dioxygenase-like cupin family protein